MSVSSVDLKEETLLTENLTFSLQQTGLEFTIIRCSKVLCHTQMVCYLIPISKYTEFL